MSTVASIEAFDTLLSYPRPGGFVSVEISGDEALFESIMERFKEQAINKVNLYNKIKGEEARILGETLPQTQIEALTINIAALDKDGAIALSQGISNSMIKELDVRDAFSNFESTQTFFENLQGANFKKLYVGNALERSSSLESVSIIAAFIKALELESFTTGIGNLGTDGARIIAEAVSETTLKELQLHSFSIGEAPSEDFSSFARALENTELKKLHFYFFQSCISPPNLEILFRSLQTTGVQTLRLEGSYIGPKAADVIVRNITGTQLINPILGTRASYFTSNFDNVAIGTELKQAITDAVQGNRTSILDVLNFYQLDEALRTESFAKFIFSNLSIIQDYHGLKVSLEHIHSIYTSDGEAISREDLEFSILKHLVFRRDNDLEIASMIELLDDEDSQEADDPVETIDTELWIRLVNNKIIEFAIKYQHKALEVIKSFLEMNNLRDIQNIFMSLKEEMQIETLPKVFEYIRAVPYPQEDTYFASEWENLAELLISKLSHEQKLAYLNQCIYETPNKMLIQFLAESLAVS